MAVFGFNEVERKGRFSFTAGRIFPSSFFFSSAMCLVKSDSATPWTVACQVPQSMEFSRQEYESELIKSLLTLLQYCFCFMF